MLEWTIYLDTPSNYWGTSYSVENFLFPKWVAFLWTMCYLYYFLNRLTTVLDQYKEINSPPIIQSGFCPSPFDENFDWFRTVFNWKIYSVKLIIHWTSLELNFKKSKKKEIDKKGDINRNFFQCSSNILR